MKELLNIKALFFSLALLASLASRAQINFQFPGMQAQTAPIPVNGTSGGPQVGDTAVAANAEYISDYIQKTGLIDSAFIKNIITFRLNEALPFMLTKPFTAQLTYKLYFTGKDGKTYDSVSANQTLTINYDTAKAATYHTSNSLVFYNGYQVKVRVVGITGADASILPLLEVGNTVVYHNYYHFNCANSAVAQINILSPTVTGSSIPDELPVSWAAQPGVSGYDLEWTYVDSSAFLSNKYGTPGTASFYQNVFLNNATRVNLDDTATSYAIPLLFEKQGIVYVRIRSVQNIPNGRRMESDWEAYNSYGFGGHQTNLNWQSSTAYAEDGKRNAVVRYYDGSLRSRQVVTKDNSTHTTVVTENFYDYQGRPVIKVLPAPTISTLIAYTPQFNNINNGEYDKTHFDRSMAAYTCNAHADSMSNVYSGASQYYSPNNPEKNTAFNQWIPDAQDYPFTEVKYMADNTGRIASQGGVGPLHQIGSGHETLYYYGNPDQVELDALFGTEVGYASHYLKNMIRDANGQYSVAYMDFRGRTIATALAGNVPDSIRLDYLSSKKDSVLTKTLTDSTNNIVQDLTTESSKSLMLTQADNIAFNYTLPPSALVLKNCSGQPVSYNCLYDLQITITDDCNNQKLGGQPYVYSRTGISSATPVSFSLSLPEGSYTVTKKLSINEASLAYYADTLFMQNNLCKTLNNFISAYIDSFKVANPGCGITDCGTCLAALGSYASFRTNFIKQNGWTGLTINAATEATIQSAYNLQKSNCSLLCPTQANKIDEITSDMEQDMTPPFGQYADTTNIDNWSVFRHVTAILSVFPLRNFSGPLYQLPTIQYLDENQQLDHVYINGVATLPNNLSRADFVSNFKPSWADALLSRHPEYNRLQYLINNVSRASFTWDNDFTSVTTFSAAYAQGYLNPTNNTAFVHRFTDISFPVNASPAIRDSFFIRNPAQLATMNATMNNYYTSQAEGTVTIWGLASGLGYCSPTNNACVLSNKVTPFADVSTCQGSADMAWKSFMSLYETKKQTQIQNAVIANNPIATALETSFQSGAHTSQFEMNASTTVGDSLGINTTNVTQQGLASNEAVIASRMGGSTSTCAGYATVWWSQLAPCTTAKLQSDSAAIISSLIKVCEKGSDTQHPYGASSIAPDSSYTFHSFDDVVAYYVHQYNISHSDSISRVACNGELILYPQGYNATPSMVNVLLYAKPDSCQCSRISTLYAAYQVQPAAYASFSDYVQKNLSVSMTEGALDSIRALCSGSITCNYLANPINIPPALQCGYTSGCVNCIAFQNWVDSFNVAYPGVAPSNNFSDSLQQQKNQLFTSFMNNKLGFNRQFDDYLTFMDTCSHFNFTSSNCASLRWTVYNPGTGLNINSDLYAAAIDNLLPIYPFFAASDFAGPSASQASDYVLVDKLDSIVTTDSLVIMQWRVKPASLQDMVNPVIQTGNNTYIGAQWTRDPIDTTWLIATTNVQVSGGFVKGMGLQSNSHSLIASWVTITSGSSGTVLFTNNFAEAANCPGSTSIVGSPTLCPGNDSLLPVLAPVVASPCADSTDWATSRATNVYSYYSDSVQGSFQNAYIGLCLQAVTKESFTATQSVSEYQYTLYYYDQAGNLVKTVPPAGVVRNYDPVWLQQVDQARAKGQSLTPAHTLVAQYRYNTLNAVITHLTPDGEQASFWYDRLGRTALSQNAKQLAEGNNYGYTVYDPLGRIIETGQINGGIGAVSKTTASTPAQWQQWLATNNSNRYQVTTTVFDVAGPAAISPWLVQISSTLRNRVSYSSITPGQKGTQPTYTTYYNYDIEGNVQNFLHDYSAVSPMGSSGQRYKRIDYQYDLISGKVNSVTYQAGRPDAFMHIYQYDAENRLTDVFTSADSVTVEHEVHYTYYKHGPLARELLGDNQVQGLDYAYTLEGWLKGVNSTALNPTADMGQDGNSADQYTQYIGRDAYGFSLHYYDGDYYAITNPLLFNGLKQQLGTGYKPLYNGNISSMAVNIGSFNGPRLYNYEYDQLNRIAAMDVLNGSNANTGLNLWDNGLTATNEYKERVAYDPNGNIQRYLRNGYGNVLGMDSLNYAYTPGTNRLDHISDSVPSGNYTTDIDKQDTLNYGYDAIGDLTRDRQSGISNILWTVYGKIGTIQKTGSTISYQYDAATDRIGKTASGANTWYVRDAQGNVLAVYGGGSMTLQEQHLYGRSRIGMVTNPAVLTSTAQYLGSKLGSGYLYVFDRGNKRFELANHLGNVLVTVSDRKFGVASPGGVAVAYYTPNVVNAQDYYPFGSLMPGRDTTFNGNGLYRYGFNGKENDNEVKGVGDQQDYGMRIYDPRVGRFLSVDPITQKYPELTPYQFASNRPIDGLDRDGLEFFQAMGNKGESMFHYNTGGFKRLDEAPSWMDLSWPEKTTKETKEIVFHFFEVEEKLPDVPEAKEKEQKYDNNNPDAFQGTAHAALQEKSEKVGGVGAALVAAEELTEGIIKMVDYKTHKDLLDNTVSSLTAVSRAEELVTSAIDTKTFPAALKYADQTMSSDLNREFLGNLTNFLVDGTVNFAKYPKAYTDLVQAWGNVLWKNQDAIKKGKFNFSESITKWLESSNPGNTGNNNVRVLENLPDGDLKTAYEALHKLGDKVETTPATISSGN